MRVLSEHTLPDGVKGTLYSWNGKFILKLENGFLEQTYKISELEVSGQKEVEELLNSPDFQAKAMAIFGLMGENMESLF